MMRKAIATGVVSGALVLGAGFGTAAVAGAATSPTGAAAPSTTHDCTKAPAAVARIQQREAKVQAAVPKLQQRLTAAQQAGKTKRADVLQKLLARAQKYLTKAPARIQKIQAACPGS